MHRRLVQVPEDQEDQEDEEDEEDEAGRSEEKHMIPPVKRKK